MGGRGSRIPGIGVPVEKREYSTIAYIDGVPVVQWDKGVNNSTIMLSDKAYAYYAYSKERKQIEKVYLYDEQHRIYKQIEFKESGKEHFHYFTPDDNGGAGRISHIGNNIHPLTEQEWSWVRKARNFNNKHRIK